MLAGSEVVGTEGLPKATATGSTSPQMPAAARAGPSAGPNRHPYQVRHHYKYHDYAPSHGVPQCIVAVSLGVYVELVGRRASRGKQAAVLGVPTNRMDEVEAGLEHAGNGVWESVRTRSALTLISGHPVLLSRCLYSFSTRPV